MCLFFFPVTPAWHIPGCRMTLEWGCSHFGVGNGNVSALQSKLRVLWVVALCFYHQPAAPRGGLEAQGLQGAVTALGAVPALGATAVLGIPHLS